MSVCQSDDREFPSTTRTLQKSGNLTIARLTTDDHGRYECVARNVIADVITVTFIIIEGLRYDTIRYDTMRYEMFVARCKSWHTVIVIYRTEPHTEQEGQHPLTGQRAANFRLLANQ